ncbi:hypothetical protein ABZ477_09510 [Microbacterium sp. NPDC019599]|uniref:hypothetical protein n=1 Tax=Microbacterium sp. NPDC019599 TaxID=3154690 RepID=UPI00340802F1
MRRRIALTAAAIIALASIPSACATPRGPGGSPGGAPAPTETLVHGSAEGGPPPFVVRYDQTELQLAATSWCYGNGCADGMDENPPSIGSPSEVLVFVPVTSFDELSVSQTSGERWACDSRLLEAVVEDLGGGWWSIEPRGPADDYLIDLFASGDGDMAASFRWTTTEDRPLPEPTASLALVVDHDGEPDSYGLELSVANLSATPEEYSATISTTASNARSLTFDAQPAEHCAGEGALYFDEPDAEAKAAAELGDFPFEYRVVLELDGETYVAEATYPDDLIEEHGVAVDLEFTPALP